MGSKGPIIGPKLQVTSSEMGGTTSTSLQWPTRLFLGIVPGYCFWVLWDQALFLADCVACILYIKAKMVSVRLFVRPGADLGFRTSTDGQDQVLKSRSLDGRGGQRRRMAAATILSRCDQRSLRAYWWWIVGGEVSAFL